MAGAVDDLYLSIFGQCRCPALNLVHIEHCVRRIGCGRIVLTEVGVGGPQRQRGHTGINVSSVDLFLALDHRADPSEVLAVAVNGLPGSVEVPLAVLVLVDGPAVRALPAVRQRQRRKHRTERVQHGLQHRDLPRRELQVQPRAIQNYARELGVLLRLLAAQVVRPQRHDQPAGGVGQHHYRSVLPGQDIQRLRQFREVAAHAQRKVRTLALAQRAPAPAQIQRVKRVAVRGELVRNVGVEEIVGHAVDPQHRRLSRGAFRRAHVPHQHRLHASAAVGVLALGEHGLFKAAAEDVWLPVQFDLAVSHVDDDTDSYGDNLWPSSSRCTLVSKGDVIWSPLPNVQTLKG